MRILLHHQSSGLFFDYESLMQRQRLEVNVPRQGGGPIGYQRIEYRPYLIDVPSMLQIGALVPVVLFYDTFDELMRDQYRLLSANSPMEGTKLQAILREQEVLLGKIKRNGGITPC